MIITVGGLHQGRTTARSSERPDQLGFGEGEIEFLEPIGVVAEITRMGFDVYVDCRISTAIELACGRCLEKFRKDVAVRSKMLFVPGKARDKGRASKDGVFLYHEVIDLADRIGEAIREELPMKPLCKPDCRGLCPHCGKNLNEGDCDCDKKEETYHPFKDLKWKTED